ncbi:MAG: cytochrome c1 [Pseudomonadota bacterium]
MLNIKSLIPAVALAAAGLLGAEASAAEGVTKALKDTEWSWEGPFGSYDQRMLQRGFQVYREVCANCHSLELIAFRHLGEKGGPFYLEKCPEELGLPDTVDCSNPISNPVVKSLAAEFTVTDGPDEFGDMFERPGIPADYYPSIYANKQQAIAANGGAYPPDQSLLVKARPNGADYMYSLLTGYPEMDPEVLDVPPGQYYNPFYPGDSTGLLKAEYLDETGYPLKKKIKEMTDEKYLSDEGYIYGGAFKMSQPLYDEMVEYTDGTPMTMEQYAKDVTAFLMWAAEPKLEQRKSMGSFVMVYLIIFAGVTYMSYKRVWSNVGKS